MAQNTMELMELLSARKEFLETYSSGYSSLVTHKTDANNDFASELNDFIEHLKSFKGIYHGNQISMWDVEYIKSDLKHCPYSNIRKQEAKFPAIYIDSANNTYLYKGYTIPTVLAQKIATALSKTFIGGGGMIINGGGLAISASGGVTLSSVSKGPVAGNKIDIDRENFIIDGIKYNLEPKQSCDVSYSIVSHNPGFWSDFWYNTTSWYDKESQDFAILGNRLPKITEELAIYKSEQFVTDVEHLLVCKQVVSDGDHI